MSQVPRDAQQSFRTRAARMTRLAIVTTAFGHAQYLPGCLASVDDQTLSGIRLLNVFTSH